MSQTDSHPRGRRWQGGQWAPASLSHRAPPAPGGPAWAYGALGPCIQRLEQRVVSGQNFDEVWGKTLLTYQLVWPPELQSRVKTREQIRL